MHGVDASVRGNRGFCFFGFFQPEQEKEKRNKAERKKDGSAAVMQGTVNDVGIPVSGGHGKKINPKSVTQNTQWKNCEREDRLLPWAAQEKVAGNQAGDEEDETRSDAAAFLRYDDG